MGLAGVVVGDDGGNFRFLRSGYMTPETLYFNIIRRYYDVGDVLCICSFISFSNELLVVFFPDVNARLRRAFTGIRTSFLATSSRCLYIAFIIIIQCSTVIHKLERENNREKLKSIIGRRLYDFNFSEPVIF